MMRLVALLFVLAMLAATDPARADEFDIAGRHIKIETSEGYCAVGHSDPADKLIYGVVNEASRGLLRALALQADCAALDEFRRNRSLDGQLEPALLFQLNLLNGEAEALPLTRDKFLEMMESALKSQYSDEMWMLAKQNAQAAIARVREKMGAAMAGTTLTDMQVLGVLDRDDFGVYVGIVQTVEENGASRILAGVGASTLVNGLPVTVTLMKRYVGPEQFPSITSEVKHVLQEFIGLNEDPI